MLRIYTCLTDFHDLRLVAVAAVLCILGAHTTFTQLSLVRDADARRRRRWIAIAALTTGTAIWSTHFVAMLAFRPDMPARFDPGLTLISLILPVAICGVAFRLAFSRPEDWFRLLLSGAVLGGGIAAMHYMGMAAYDPGGILLWDHDAVVVSIVSGIVATAAATLVGLRYHGAKARLAGAALLTAGICLLHFIGMTAVIILPEAGMAPARGTMTRGWLAALVACTGLGLVGLGLGAAILSRHARRRLLMKALVDSAGEGLLICEAERMVLSNHGLQGLLQRDGAWFAGRPLTEVIEDPALRAAVLDKGGVTLELTVPAADGSRIPVEATSRQVFFDGLAQQVITLRDLRDRYRAEERIRFLALHDPLTQLPNRAGFAAAMAPILACPGADRGPYTLLALDLDRFKTVNDTLGHAVGDALLVKVAARLRAGVRSGDIVCRVGGDEFAVMQFARGDEAAGAALAQRLIDLLSRPFLIQGHVLNIGASVGIAIEGSCGDDLAEVTRSADLALYRAKMEGRGAHRFFDSEMDSRMQSRRLLELELRTALVMRQFHLLYQPQLDASAGRIAGFEALIRWTHPQRGVVPPVDFIPVAEETGLIIPIGEWVLAEACREVAGWPGRPVLSVNLSAVQFRSPGLVEMVRNACADGGFDPSRLELEITESLLLNDSAATLETLHGLKALGVRIALDDFGTGYSSLSYLRSFPFDRIKIDRSFVGNITQDSETAAIVRAIIHLGRCLGMQTTVEGVETVEQFDHLRDEGCDQVQGYLIGRPMAPEAAMRMMNGAGTGRPADERAVATA